MHPLQTPSLPQQAPAPRVAGKRWWHAFSLKENLTELFAPPPMHSRPIDGLRALSILWVITFHTFMLIGVYMPREEFVRLFQDTEGDFTRKWVLRGDLGVDLFFVLSGYLITRILMVEQERTGTMRIPLFYARRLMRLMPAYALVLLLYVLGKAPNYQNAWANLLYVNNFLPVTEQAMVWSWSLAIEEQFYLVFPFFWLGISRMRRGALALMGGLLLVGVGLQFWQVSAHGFTMPFPIDPVMQLDSGQRYFDLIYCKPYMRFGPILCGVIVAYLMAKTQAPQVLRASRMAASGLLGLALVCLAIVLVPKTFSGTWGAMEGAAFISLYRQLFGLGASCILLLVLSEAGAGRLIGRILALRIFRPIAQLSYAAYLVHPLIIFSLYATLELKTPADVSMTRLFLMALAGTLVLSTILYAALEKPLMRLRPA